jgi:hypothetical protein
MIKNSKSVVEVKEGDTVEVLLPETSFYLKPEDKSLIQE